MFYVYILQNNITEKVYVGSSTQLKIRWRSHISNLVNNKHKNAHLQAAWNKYGEKAFDFYVLDQYSSKEEMCSAEEFYIAWYKSLGLSYNLSDKAINTEFVYRTTEEIREKISNSKRGKVYTEEQRKRLSDAHKGQVAWNKGKTGVFSEESLQKKSESRRKTQESPDYIHPLKGTKLSEERKQKMSETSKTLGLIPPSRKGCKMPEDCVKAQSERYKGEGNPFYGKKHSPESIAKRQESRKRNQEAKLQKQLEEAQNSSGNEG